MLFKNLKKALEERDAVTGLKITIKEASLPEELFHFPHLKELYLEAPALKDIPSQLNWPELTLIQIKAPQFKGSLAPLFYLPKLTNLKTLETPLHPLRLALGGGAAPLRFITLKDAGLKELPIEFGELSTLEELYMPGNELSDLPSSFKELTKLKWLNADNNQFSIFPPVLSQMASLKHLSLDSNPFSEEEKERIQRQFNLTIG